MTQMTLSHSAGPNRFERGYQIARWAAITLALAFFAPFFLGAMFAAVFALLGTDAANVHQSVVMLATMDASSWSSAGSGWQFYTWVCGLVVVIFRVLTATPVKLRLNELSYRFDGWLEKKPALMLAPLAAIFLLVIIGLAEPSRPDPVQPLVLPGPVPKNLASSAALSLPDGRVRSGAAVVEKRDADTFVVTFNKDAAN